MVLRQCLNYSKGSYFKNTVLVFIFVLRAGGIISQQKQKISSTLYIKEWHGHSTGNFILPLSLKRTNATSDHYTTCKTLEIYHSGGKP